MVTINPVASARRNGVYSFWKFHVLKTYRVNDPDPEGQALVTPIRG